MGGEEFFGGSKKLLQLVKGDRFKKVGDSAELTSPVEVGLDPGGADDEDRDVREGAISSQPAQNIEAIFARHVDVQENEAGKRISQTVSELALGREVSDGFFAIFDELKKYRILHLPNGTSHEENVIFVILGDQYCISGLHHQGLTRGEKVRREAKFRFSRCSSIAMESTCL